MNFDEQLQTFQNLYDSSNRIVFFGGAGVSTESGIPDFRSQDGLYNQQWDYPPETIIGRTFFDSNPSEFYRFYRQKLIIKGVQPNITHLTLTKMEQAGKLSAIVTQNIDGLHQAAGSKNVFELHGSTLRNFCMKCHRFYDIDFIANSEPCAENPKGIPLCTECGGLVKPDVVLYEEGLDDWTIQKSIEAISTCDTLIIGGTSLIVYPAASFVEYFRGKHLVLINKSITAMDNRAELVIHEPIGEVLSKITI